MSHYGYMRTISNFEELGKHIDDMQRHLDMLNGDGSWMGVSLDYFVLRYTLQPYTLPDAFPSTNGGSY
jgi:hypothetical protein